MMETMLPHLDGEYLRLTKDELLKRRYELLYLEGKVNEMVHPPFDVLFQKEPLVFKLKTTVKRLFPTLHNIYRNRKKYE